MKISAIILEGSGISSSSRERCLNSVSWCDETIEIKTAELKGNFSDWRNEGFKKSKGDWILYVDTDEEVAPELSNEIQEITNHKLQITNSAYAIPRRNFIFGKEFKYGGQYPDYQKRLFLKKNFKKWTGDLHEEPEFIGKLGTLKNPLVHHKDITISQMVEKTNKWSELEAKLMFDANHPPMNFFRFFSAGLREFWLRMVVQLGFLDGSEGIIYSLYQVYSRLISYSKLWEMQLKNNNESGNS